MSAGASRLPSGAAPDVRIHPSADVEEGAKIGAGALVWHQSQVRSGASVGAGCIIGKGAYVGGGVTVGENCKIENYACLYEGVILEDGVFVGPAVVFTNDRFPRAVNPDGSLKSAGDWELGRTLVRFGAAVGAGSVILPGVTIGEWALVAAGSVVTSDVKPHALVRGSPARQGGWVCRCARPLPEGLECDLCGFAYKEVEGRLVEASLDPESGTGAGDD